MTRFTHSRIDVAIGVTLEVIQSGDPAGTPLVLVHGISDSAKSMQPLMAELPASIRAIALTVRGHGDSDEPAGPYDTATMARDVAAVMDAVGVRRAALLGHSMGSMIAQRFAVDYPERLTALMLEGAFPGLKGNPAVGEFYAAEIAPLQEPVDPAWVRGFQESTLARPVPPAFLELVIAEALKLPPFAWRAILSGQMGEDFDAQLPRIAAPTLLLWGDQDAFCSREDQGRLLRGIRGSRLQVFEGTGHDPHWEEPARVARIVAEFVQRHAALAPA
jgi:pimeloyl-ACP methyl ester carboxylesterase